MKILEMAGGQASDAVQGRFEAPPPHIIRGRVRSLTDTVNGGLLVSAAAQQEHRALRAMGALSLPRDSHRASAIHMKELSVPRTGRSNCARSRHTKYQPDQPQHRRRSGASASHISGEVKLGSFSGIPAEMREAQEGSMSDELAAHDSQVYMDRKPYACAQAST